MRKREVVITGPGIVTSLGVGWDAFTRGLLEGRSAFSRCQIEGLEEPIVGGWLPLTEFESQCQALKFSADDQQKLGKLAQEGRPSVAWSAVAGLEAFRRAGLLGDYVAEDVGLIVGGSNFSLDAHFRETKKFLQDANRVSPRWALRFADTDHLGAISELLGIRGEGFTVGGNSASGNLALIQGWRAVASEASEACVVIAAMSELSPVEIQALRFVGALGGKRFGDEPAQACRPFDAQHEGFVLGQGCAAVVLETEERARRRGAEIFARVEGGAIRLDANRSSNPNPEGQARCLGEALRSARCGIERIDYLNTHGSSSPLGDRSEVTGLRAALGERVGQIRMNSTKGLTGHCLTAAGMIETVAVLAQMRGGFVHPNRNLEQSIAPDFRLMGAQAEDGQINTAVNVSYAFGGINSAVVFSRV